MIGYLRLEWRLAGGGWAWLLLLLFGVLRGVGAVVPTAGWLSFLSAAYPLGIALAAIRLFDQERRWRTQPILAAAPRSCQTVFVIRFLFVAAPLLALPFVILASRDALDVAAPAVLLASVVLTLAVARGMEWGAGVALAWWAISFLALVSGAEGASAAVRWLCAIAAPRTSVSTGSLAVPIGKLAVAGLILLFPIARKRSRS